MKSVVVKTSNEEGETGLQTHPQRLSGQGQVHVLTLTPFFPSAENNVRGCFIREPLDELERIGVASSVFAVNPVYYPRRTEAASSPAYWVRYPQLPGNLGLSSSGRLLYACMVRRVMRLHRRRAFHLIHAHGALPCGHAAKLLAERLGIPYVITVHGLDVFNGYHGQGASARWRRDRSIEVYSAASKVVCISGKVEQILQAGIPQARTAVVYNGVDFRLFSPEPAPAASRQQTLLAVGDLIPTKGHESVLRAIGHFAPSFPQLRGQFIGEGADGGRLQSLARELGITDRIEFLGRRSRAEVAAAMRKCYAFVLPSRSEGLGCVYLEAMACAKPVIACRGQGIEEVIEPGKNGYLVAPDAQRELLENLSLLLNSADLSARMGSAGRETILNKLTLAHQAKALGKIYCEAIAGHS